MSRTRSVVQGELCVIMRERSEVFVILSERSESKDLRLVPCAWP